MEAVVEAIRHPFLVLYPDLTIAKANSSFFEKFRLPPDVIHGCSLFKLGGCWDNAALRTMLEETLLKDSSFDDFELEYDVPGEGPLTLRVSGRRVLPIDGPVPKIVLSMEDITEQKRLQRELRDSEIRYRRLFESAEDGILLLDFETGRIEDANPYLIRILGWSLKDLQGKEVWDLGLFENAGSSRSTFETLQEKGYIRFENQPLRTRDGRSIEAEFICTVYQAGNRKTVQCHIRDVSERKRAEAEYFRNEEKFRQSQKMEALGKLAGGIAHDFNNLLTAINGYCDLCLAMAEGKGPMHESLEEILRAGERAAGLTRQILAYSRQQVLAPKAIRLNDLVVDMKKMLERILGDPIRIELDLDPGLGLIKADPSQMEQVILNLAVNARDAMAAGGTLTFETRAIDAGKRAPPDAGAETAGAETAGAETASGKACVRCALLAVRDTGIGMDPGLVARIFDPFYTTKGIGADPKGGTGTGMGLSVVHGIVTQSGGGIEVESEPGRGTTFRIFLPIAEEGTEEHRKPRAVTDSRGSETVLLVEDEEVVRRFCRRALETQGYRVLEAGDGESALSVAEGFEGPIHLLLTDLMMPGMGGRSLAERLLRNKPECSILFMSGYTSDSAFSDEFPEYHAGFLQKPFAAEALLEKVQECLSTSPVAR